MGADGGSGARAIPPPAGARGGEGGGSIAEVLRRCPDASKGVNHVMNTFFRMGLTAEEAVALMGAHTVGGMHRPFCGFDGHWTETAYCFDNSYFMELTDNTWELVSNPGEPARYQARQSGEGDERAEPLTMLSTDVALLRDERFSSHAHGFANDESRWFVAFATAFKKLTELGWEGQLRETGWNAGGTVFSVSGESVAE